MGERQRVTRSPSGARFIDSMSDIPACFPVVSSVPDATLIAQCAHVPTSRADETGNANHPHDRLVHCSLQSSLIAQRMSLDIFWVMVAAIDLSRRAMGGGRT